MTIELFPGSYRNVPFETDQTVDTGGPVGVVHRFPGRGLPHVEQLSKGDDRFSITAHLVGDDFQQRLDDLLEAINTPGPGTLVHWSLGTIRVSFDVEAKYNVTLSNQELRKASITIPFIRVEKDFAPVFRSTTPADVAVKRDSVVSAVAAATEGDFNVTGQNFLSTNATARLNALTADLRRAQGRINATFAPIDDASAAIDAFGDAVAELIRSPRTMSVHVTGLINSVLTQMGAITNEARQLGRRGDVVEDSDRINVALSVLASMGDYGDDFEPVDQVTATREQEASNDAALRDMVQASTLSEVITAISAIPLESLTQAEDIRVRTDDRFDALLDRVVDDGLDAALRDLRASFYAHLQATAANLSELSEYTPKVSVPALLIAYRLYGDPFRDEEILRRNPSVSHPGIVAGGVPIEVLLTDA